MRRCGTIKSIVTALSAVLFFVFGAWAENLTGTKPPPTDATKRKILPLMEKLPPLPPAKPKKKLPPNFVVVRVNGVDITISMINRQVDLMVTLLRNKSKKITAQKLKAFRANITKRVSDELYMRTIIDTCLAASNITVSAEIQESVEKGFLRRYAASRTQTLEELKAVAAKAGRLRELETQLKFEARYKTFLTTVYSNRYFVADAEVQKHKKRVAAYNARSAATNELHFAAAKKMAETAKREGEDFAKLADKFSQDPEKHPGGYIGEMDESDFSDEPHVWRAITALKAGGVTDALEIETGYAVYKLISIKKAEDSNTGAVTYELARIFYRKAFVFPEQSDAEFRSDVEAELRDKLNKELIRVFRKQSKVERPNGAVDTP